MAIHILDAGTIGKISAGEVVERPASVVKELMENAIDAGSTAVTVEIKDGGITYLRVTDNGCGIPFAQARLAFENHATSKLVNADGLWDIRTLGFRGEALPSIAAVSRVTMTTRVKGAEFGAKVMIEGGVFQSISEAGCPEGTTLVMKDLFFNLPVRRAFLKKPNYEQGLVSDVVQKLILGNPGVAARFISNGKTLFQSVGDGDMRHAALAVYGRECAQALKEIQAYEGAFSMRGWMGVGDQARPTRAQQSFFINGRLIRCPLLTQALEEACRGRVTVGMYPMCALSITLPPESVDINVHPSKLEVRFRDEAAFRLTAQSLFARVFAEDRMISAFAPLKIAPEVKSVVTHTPPETPAQPAPEEKLNAARAPVKPASEAGSNTARTPAQVPAQAPAGKPAPAAPSPATEIPADTRADALHPYFTAGAATVRVREGGFVPRADAVAAVQMNLRDSASEQTQLPRETLPAKEDQYRVIGTLFQTYILLESDDALLLIDQHAAHERLNFEEYKHRLDGGAASQQLLVPYIVHVSRREAQLLLDQQELLREAGYEIEPFGEADLQVRAVPFVLGQADMRMLFTELIDCLDTLKNAEKEKRMAEIIQASCKHAVKAGDRLTDGEIRGLLSAMRESGAPPTCPHGRPVMRAITKRELERMFKRVQ